MRTRDQAHVEFNWLTPSEFGRQAGGVKSSTVIAAIKAGEIQNVQKTRGGQYRIPPAELDRWIEEHTVRGRAA